MNFKKKNQQRGLSIIEAVVATVIISIGFVSIIKSVNSSVQTVISSGYQSKVSHLMAFHKCYVQLRIFVKHPRGCCTESYN